MHRKHNKLQNLCGGQFKTSTFPPPQGIFRLECSKTSPQGHIFSFSQSLFMLKLDNSINYFEAILSEPFTHTSKILSLKNSSTPKNQEKTMHKFQKTKSKIRFKFVTLIKFPTPHAWGGGKLNVRTDQHTILQYKTSPEDAGWIFISRSEWKN